MIISYTLETHWLCDYLNCVKANTSTLDFLQSINKVKECGICFSFFVISKDSWRIIFHVLTNKNAHNTNRYQHNKQLLGEQASFGTFNLASKIATNKNAQCSEIQPILNIFTNNASWIDKIEAEYNPRHTIGSCSTWRARTSLHLQHPSWRLLGTPQAQAESEFSNTS